MAVTGHPRHLQVRHGTEAAWASADPVLRDGEPGFETDTGVFKLGDGVTVWSLLDGISGGGGGDDSILDGGTSTTTDFHGFPPVSGLDANSSGILKIDGGDA